MLYSCFHNGFPHFIFRNTFWSPVFENDKKREKKKIWRILPSFPFQHFSSSASGLSVSLLLICFKLPRSESLLIIGNFINFRGVFVLIVLMAFFSTLFFLYFPLLGSGCCERSAFGNEITSIADVIPVTSKCLNFYHCRCGSAAAAAAAAMINHHLCAGFAIHWLILVCHSHSTSAVMLKFWYQKPLEKSGVIRRSANGERI